MKKVLLSDLKNEHNGNILLSGDVESGKSEQMKAWIKEVMEQTDEAVVFLDFQSQYAYIVAKKFMRQSRFHSMVLNPNEFDRTVMKFLNVIMELNQYSERRLNILIDSIDDFYELGVMLDLIVMLKYSRVNNTRIIMTKTTRNVGTHDEKRTLSCLEEFVENKLSSNI
ncbi:hypothetical protein G7059_03665 [Erysipelothrix sp. HDW6A]|uniref:hypothetical protein n=1 Tax=Erysipelothrix sp. HDW6A TaxID=2714928 RepID=UPI00140C78AC|nr:hypothetical protein [Erysipelothrix sp. HDW6A]QIK57009.1 hypothetical protein G7059_03665 [Erysipelothrix sp. HDW6A]